MVWIQQWGKMFDRNQKETFRMRDWCSAEGNRGRTVDLQTKNTNEHWWTRASEPFMWGKAQSDMKIERACLPYVPAKVLLWVLFLLLCLCSRLTFSIKLPGRLHCLWAHYRDTLCFVLQWGLFLFKETWQMEAKPLKSPLWSPVWTEPVQIDPLAATTA